jgi:hypothetical protein
MDDHVPFRERLTCSIAAAVEASGISRAQLYRMIGAGKIATVKVGDRRLVKVASLIQLLDPAADEGMQQSAAASGGKPVASGRQFRYRSAPEAH